MNTSNRTEPTDEERKYSTTDIRHRNIYLREFLPAMVGYGIVLAVVLSVVDENTSGARVWILLPVVPLALVAVAVYRSVQRADEYSRLLQLESMALGFGASILTALVFGFLGVVGVALTWSGWIVFAAGMLTWGLSLAYQGAR